MYTDFMLKEATQVAYIDFEKLITSDRKIENYTISELVEIYYSYNKNNRPIGNYNAISKLDLSIVGSWKIVQVHDTNQKNGFYGCVIDTGNNNGIIGFRGSEGMGTIEGAKLDWAEADLALLSSLQTNQQMEAEEFMKEVSGLNNFKSLTITGHSLGGNLAEHAMITAEKCGVINVSRCISFDGPGFSTEYVAFHGKEINSVSSKMYHYRWSGIGNILQDLPGVHYETLKVKKGNFFDSLIGKHATTFLQFNEAGQALRGDASSWDKALGSVTKRIDVLPHFICELLVGSISSLLIVNATKSINSKNNSNQTSLTSIISTLMMYKCIANNLVNISRIILIEILVHSLIRSVEITFKNLKKTYRNVVNSLQSVLKWSEKQVNKIVKNLNNTCQQIQSWFSGEKCYAKYYQENHFIRLDTNQLLYFAKRLENVKHRINEINHYAREIPIIYDIQNTSYKLSHCIHYLLQTKEEFEALERDLSRR